MPATAPEDEDIYIRSSMEEEVEEEEESILNGS